jgi:thioredoxin reductase (NADPH)
MKGSKRGSPIENQKSEIENRTADIAIIGAGPTGLACALGAKERGLDHVVIDKGTIVSTIVGYPINMTFFSTPDKLELGSMPFTSPNFRPSRLEAIEYYRGVVRKGGLNLSLHNRVGSVERLDGEFVVHTERGDLRARNVVLATGYFENTNRLGIEGEDLPKVRHYYREPFEHYDQEVLVIGGRNSAVETALDLFRHGVRVTMIHRGDALGRGVKSWIRPDIENRIANNDIAMHWRTVAAEIRPESVLLERLDDGSCLEIPNDAIYAMIGHRPDVALMEACGIEYDPETLIPVFNPETFESNVPGLFIAGSVACGCKTWEIFIENGRAHAGVVIGEIARRMEGTLAH